MPRFDSPAPPIPPPVAARIATKIQFFVNGMLFATWGVHVPTVKTLFGLDEARLSWLMLSIGIGSLISLTQVGGWVGRHGPRKVVASSGLLVTLSLAALLWMPGYFAAMGALFLFGLANGAFDVSMNAEAAAVEHAYARPIMSSFHGFFSLGGFAGALIASLVSAAGVAPRTHLAACSITGLVLILAASRYMLPTEPIPSTEKPGGFRLPHGTILLLGFMAALGLVGEGAMYDWSTLYMAKTLNTPPQIAALGYGAFSIAMAAGRFGGDWLRARLGAGHTLSLSAWLAAFALGITLAIGHPAAALAGFALTGLGFSNMIPVLFAAASKVPGVSAATGIAGVSGIGYLGFMMGPPVIGAIAHALGLPLALSMVAGFTIISALLARRAMRAVEH